MRSEKKFLFTPCPRRPYLQFDLLSVPTLRKVNRHLALLTAFDKHILEKFNGDKTKQVLMTST